MPGICSREFDMRTTRLLLFIALLTICTSIVRAEESDTGGTYSNEVIEEVVAVGESRCGTWPIEHKRLIGCDSFQTGQPERGMNL